MSQPFADTLIKSFFKRTFLIAVIVSIVLATFSPVLKYLSDVDSYKKESIAIINRFIKNELYFDPKNIMDEPWNHHELFDKLSNIMVFGNFVEIKIWDDDTTLLYSFADNDIVGRKFPLNRSLAETLSTGREIVSIESAGDEDAVAIKHIGKYFEIYAPIKDGGKIIGAVEIYRMPPDVNFYGVHSLFITVFALAIPLLLYLVLFGQFRKAGNAIARYDDSLRSAYDSLSMSYFDSIRSMIKALELRDMETEGHSERVVALSAYLGKKLSLAPDDMSKLVLGSYLHDIGKIGISDNILLKPGKLDEAEREVMKKHVQKGHDLIKGADFLNLGKDVVMFHHEKWDGTGYPEGLRGEDIPVISRIFALVDVFDALISKRPYKEAMTYERAREIILSERGSHFDPEIVDVFLATTDQEINEIIDEVKEKGVYGTVNSTIESLISGEISAAAALPE